MHTVIRASNPIRLKIVTHHSLSLSLNQASSSKSSASASLALAIGFKSKPQVKIWVFVTVGLDLAPLLFCVPHHSQVWVIALWAKPEKVRNQIGPK